jgi:hypothetical protein
MAYELRMRPLEAPPKVRKPPAMIDAQSSAARPKAPAHTLLKAAGLEPPSVGAASSE